MTASTRGTLLLDRGVGPLLVLPATLLVVVFLVGPFYYMMYTALTDLSFADASRNGNFVGLDNFRKLMRDDPLFWDSFLLTLRFVVLAVSIEFVLGFALAFLIFRFVARQRLLTTLLLIPMMIAPVAVGLIWRLLLQGDFGMVTYYMRKVGLLSQNAAVLSSPDLVFPAIVAIDVWQWTPFVTLVMLAGLMSLPRSPIEAAMMDGAGPVRVFLDVMLPLLKPIIALVLLLRGIDAFKEFDKVFIMTGGGPGTLTELVSIYAYRVNFRNWDLGYGAAVAFMVYLVVLILCSIFYKAIYWSANRPAPLGGHG
ncbi:sugar ABC transporter permease [Mesorhizobium sp. LHD-90]|uniref:carbohydrate ABC transporter permease n=1 Tax=Mesorhizobium sp. LHD-90 TaxID=3071414 RepID=UPI0027E1C1DB|nr:sugar ABC transporter permease [Mesorhizobium sp. LHD-90]MDQ6435323.1 sugar ABC transporter permease [Mesorhizobium sp. LHD-90]